MLLDLRTITLSDLPSPKGHFIIGHYPQFKSSTKHQFLEDAVLTCGPLFTINLVGKRFVASAIPELNHRILKLRPQQFRRLPKIDSVLQEMGIKGVFNAEGEDWKRHRRLTAESLSTKKVKAYYPTVLQKCETLLHKFKTYATAGKQIDIQREFMLFTIDVTTAIAFGYELDAINEKDAIFQQHLEQIFAMVNERTVAPIPIWRFYKRKKDKQLQQSLHAIEKTIYSFIKHAKATLANHPERHQQPTNFLEALLAENNEGDFSDTEVYGNIFTMLLAGEDSTSSSLSWIIYYLSQHPEMIKKVRKEAFDCYPKTATPVSYEQHQQLSYANSVVQEAIRLHPTTTQQIVQANEDCTVLGLHIPKDTRLILLNRYPQRQDEYFDKATQFIPERWGADQCPMHRKHHPDIVKGFGGGPRFCPGMHLAMAEMTTMISMLCKHFDFSLSISPEAVTEKHSFIVYPENLYVHFTAVSSF
ncbi:cytochrome P450 [Aquimarina hainanensis]|uniref:Cytochrome P450 n=1 Tax=Aquimarina hainanensis TaxID=1578017 RepID=A0ABW5NAJ2_9FLAO|nr:cytochrome P450 [Aquimarina sp. TRL1]QKX05224.1 cytochrome P450 [Aquimarina sp. TRL1]